MRLFAALDMPENIIEELRAWWTGTCIHLAVADWRDVLPENWHLTLAFYGDIDGQQVDALAEALAECTAQQAPLALKLTGFGAFPSLSRPRVIWVGVEDADESGQLKRLARCCRQAGHATVRKRGAKEQPFRGHITVARGRGFPDPIGAEAISQMPEIPELSWQVDALRLYQSMLHRDGARYRILEELELSG